MTRAELEDHEYPQPDCPPRSPKHHPLVIFEKARSKGRPVFVSAPMVRYSKLPVKISTFATDITYTPMMVCDGYLVRPPFEEFTTNSADRPVVAQFATNDPVKLAKSALRIKNFVDGIDLNCGCPQSWACQSRVGAHLMSEPQLVCDMIKEVKKAVPGLCMSVKIRVHSDLKLTVAFVKQLEAAGADYITVHGRTKNTRSSVPVDLDAIKLVKESVSIPVIANGDVDSLDDALRIAKYTGCDGVMSARGLLDNPALYAGYKNPPWSAVERYIDFAKANDASLGELKFHLMSMMDKMILKREKSHISTRKTIQEIFEWIDEYFVLRRPGDEGFGSTAEVIRKKLPLSNTLVPITKLETVNDGIYITSSKNPTSDVKQGNSLQSRYEDIPDVSCLTLSNNTEQPVTVARDS